MFISQSTLILRCAPLLCAFLLGACASKPPAMEPSAGTADGVRTVQERRILGFLTPYRPDVQQGNFISQEMVGQLKIGMTPAQVRFVLGTPLLTDVFHEDRWDYPFHLKKGDGEIISSRITVYFENDRLARIEGGNLPPEEQFLDLLTSSTKNK